MKNQPVVYRVFDADDRLIYIGATCNLEQRLIYHSTQAWWWSLAARISDEPHVDMDTAFQAEWAAIAAESPAFNIAKRPGKTPKRPYPLTPSDAFVCRTWYESKSSGHLPQALLWVVGRAPGVAAANVRGAA